MFDRGWFGRRRSSNDELFGHRSRDDGELRADAGRGPAGSFTDDHEEHPCLRDLDQDDDDLDDEEQDDDQDGFEQGPGATGPFWALKDVSFRVPPGAALGVLGGPGSGRARFCAFSPAGCRRPRGGADPRPRLATARRAHEGTGLHVQGYPQVQPGSPVPDVGIPGHLVKRHRAEIIGLARPSRTTRAIRIPRRCAALPWRRPWSSRRASFSSRSLWAGGRSPRRGLRTGRLLPRSRPAPKRRLTRPGVPDPGSRTRAVRRGDRLGTGLDGRSWRGERGDGAL